jgi:hypothetical protein
MPNLPAGIAVTDGVIDIHGAKQPLKGIQRAEAMALDTWGRGLVLTVFWLFLPILGMVIATQLFLKYDSHYRLWFGPTVLLMTVAPAILGIFVAKLWPKPWGVMIERDEHLGHDRLMVTGQRDAAEAVAETINGALAQRSH